MRVGRTLRGLSAIGALLLTLTAGCTISIQPWTKPVTIAPGPPTDFMPSPNGQGPVHKGGPSLMGGFQAHNNEIALLSARLVTTEDELNVIRAYTNTLKKEKGTQENQLLACTREIEQTLSQIQKLRQDLKGWKTDVDDMNLRIQSLETNRANMKMLLDRVDSYLSAQRDAKTAGPALR